MEELSTYQHIHSLTWKEMEMQTYSRISHTKTDTLNGSLFTLATQDHNKKLRLTSNGQIQRTTKNMKRLSTSQFLNISFLSERTNISQVLMVMSLWFPSTLEKVLSDQEMTSKQRMMHSMLLLELNNY